MLFILWTGGRIEVPLRLSRDGRERFSLDINRKRIALTTGYQGRGRQVIALIHNHQFDFIGAEVQACARADFTCHQQPQQGQRAKRGNAWVDTKDVRPANSLAFAVLNDRERKVSDAVQDALRSYDITPITWSKREEFREQQRD